MPRVFGVNKISQEIRTCIYSRKQGDLVTMLEGISSLRILCDFSLVSLPSVQDRLVATEEETQGGPEYGAMMLQHVVQD